MNFLPTQRQERIIDWLEERPLLTIDELVQSLGVSNMTVHRDLDTLVQAGLVEKVYGGVRLAKAKPIALEQQCALCSMVVAHRLGFIIHLTDEQTLQACCPHCGLLLLQGLSARLALTADFIYGNVINVFQATYVLESRIILCCSPSVLCFSKHSDALSFQAGFGGQVLAYSEAQQHLIESHQVLPKPSAK